MEEERIGKKQFRWKGISEEAEWEKWEGRVGRDEGRYVKREHRWEGGFRRGREGERERKGKEMGR